MNGTWRGPNRYSSRRHCLAGPDFKGSIVAANWVLRSERSSHSGTAIAHGRRADGCEDVVPDRYGRPYFRPHHFVSIEAEGGEWGRTSSLHG